MCQNMFANEKKVLCKELYLFSNLSQNNIEHNLTVTLLIVDFLKLKDIFVYFLTLLQCVTQIV